MTNRATNTKVAQPFWPVKSNESISIGSTIPSMIHHKSYYSKKGNLIVTYSDREEVPYDVSSDWRVLTKGVFNKRIDQIMHCLCDVVGLPPGEGLAALTLLRFGAYYGNIYPKASQCCSEPGCSKATFWRAVMHLKNLGLIRVIPRFRIDPHAKISNLYILHKLLILIARYLAEHGIQFFLKWLKPYLQSPGSAFWGQWVPSLRSNSDPGG